MRCLVLYGSQTGAAKSIAEGLHREARERGHDASLAPLNDWVAAGLDAARHVIIVASTTGDGDAPSNAEDFCRHLRKRTHPKTLLAGKRFVGSFSFRGGELLRHTLAEVADLPPHLADAHAVLVHHAQTPLTPQG